MRERRVCSACEFAPSTALRAVPLPRFTGEDEGLVHSNFCSRDDERLLRRRRDTGMKRNQSSPASRLTLILPRETGEGDHAQHGGGGASRATNVSNERGALLRAPAKTVARARRLRRTLSPPEARLWRCLKARTPEQPVFRRQHPIGPYVIDFYCAKARLAIEIDGMSHDMSDRPQRDARRDAWLRERGVTVMRIAATDLMQCFDETADAIMRMAAELSAK